ncbi:MAG: family 16 glycoside hydrolase [Planctomycetota bacterium]|nr:family 16 glycoside hydrolase [Planctomycetota bacterium]
MLTTSQDQAIWTNKDYDNFVLDLEFKTASGTNSGVVVYCSDRLGISWGSPYLKSRPTPANSRCGPVSLSYVRPCGYCTFARAAISASDRALS